MSQATPAVTAGTTKPAPNHTRTRITPPVALLVVLVAAWWIGADLIDSAVFPTPVKSA